MIDERVYELLCCQLGLANEETAGLRKQVNELIVRLKAIEYKVAMLARRYKNDGKRIDEKDYHLYIKPMEFLKEYLQGRFS